MVATLRVSGVAPDATPSAVLAGQWRDLIAGADVDDPVGLPGTGLVGLGAIVFDAVSTASSVLHVPAMIVGRYQGRSWVTRIGEAADAASTLPYGPTWSSTLEPGAQNPTGYQESVRKALELIDAGSCKKVVLARDLTGTVPADADLRRLVSRLTTSYPDTWGFAVDGLIGASPETLVSVQDGVATSRVLAGTVEREADAVADTAASAALAASTKDNEEHEFAVQSVMAAMGLHSHGVVRSERPFVLALPNVFHLATDVEARLTGATTALDVVADLHPTAAVAGTPRDAAMRIIRDLEPFDRGRYAGPVGWVDSAGNGQWAIALRCAQFTAVAGGPTLVTAYAGAGIVAGSDPETELLETGAKFRPVLEAMA